MKKAWAYIWKHSAENLILFNFLYAFSIVAMFTFNSFMPEELIVEDFVHHWMSYTAIALLLLVLIFGFIQFLFGTYEFTRWIVNKTSFYEGFVSVIFLGWYVISLVLPIAPSLTIIQHADFSGKTRRIWNPIKKMQVFLNRPKAPAILYNTSFWTCVILITTLSIIFGIVDDSNPNDTKTAFLNLTMLLLVISAILLFFIQFQCYMLVTFSATYSSHSAFLYERLQFILIFFIPYYWALILVAQKQNN